ncbi:hypothetical protein [Shewanella sp.]|uniref:hypothetical protein n=1 Tax=Shewanella sp. TaxID=50422 RepID=UPI003F2FEBD5
MATTNTSKSAAQNMAKILSAICEVGTTGAGEIIGRDPTFISRLKSGEKHLTIDEFSVLLAGIGLEVNETASDRVVIDRQLHESLLTLSKVGLQSIHTINKADI